MTVTHLKRPCPTQSCIFGHFHSSREEKLQIESEAASTGVPLALRELRCQQAVNRDTETLRPYRIVGF